MKNPFLIPSAALLLAACTVGPDYARPETPLPESWPSAGEEAGALEARWWRAYGDPALDAAVERALAHNPTVAQAVARIEEAEARLREVGGNSLPEVTADAGADRARRSSESGSPDFQEGGGTWNTFRFGLSTRFELDLWGKLDRAKEGARAQLLGNRAAAETVRLTLVGRVVQGWVSLRSLEAQAAVAAAAEGNAQSTLDLAERRAQGGAATALETAQARAQLATYRAQRLDLERQRRQQAWQLTLLCGEPAWQAPVADDPAAALESLPLPPLPPAGLPAGLVRRRPDVAEAEQRYCAANADIGYRQAFKYPTFSLTGSVGAESSDLSDILSHGASVWSVGAGVYAPLLNWGEIDAQVDQSKARAKQAAAAFEGSVQNAYVEVGAALEEVRDRRGLAEAAASKVEAAATVLAKAKQRFDTGYSPYLEVVDAERQLNEARLAAVRERQAQLAASVQLFKALGGGWRAPVPDKKR